MNAEYAAGICEVKMDAHTFSNELDKEWSPLRMAYCEKPYHWISPSSPEYRLKAFFAQPLFYFLNLEA